VHIRNDFLTACVPTTVNAYDEHSSRLLRSSHYSGAERVFAQGYLLIPPLHSEFRATPNVFSDFGNSGTMASCGFQILELWCISVGSADSTGVSFLGAFPSSYLFGFTHF
jgi:hypothetical protein